MNGMITTNENYNLDEIIPKLKAYTVGDVVSKVTCDENMFFQEKNLKWHLWILEQRIIFQNL